MNPTDTDIAALVCSRVCHDLISPVGAIANGMEVLEEESDAEMREHALELLGASAAQAGARLQFARLAFGAAGGIGAEISLEDAGEAARRLFRFLKADLDWRAERIAVDQDAARLLLNLVHMAGDALPRGGTVTADCRKSPEGVEIEVTGSGGKVYLQPEHMRLLREGGGGEALDARLIQPWFAHALAERHGARIEGAQGEDMLTFRVRMRDAHTVP
ncbi:MAG: histidine phosphotransferase family protein, partial [Alphaproteobacteria bacterium]